MHGGLSTSRHQSHSQQHQQQGEQQHAVAACATPLAVLIVEDESVSRNALRKLLAASGYYPCAYESAEDALREMSAGDMPPVALIDVDLPGMSGLDFASRLEQIRPDMIKVLITAAGGERIEKFRKDHEVHYIRKPLDFSRLLRLLGQSAVSSGTHC